MLSLSERVHGTWLIVLITMVNAGMFPLFVEKKIQMSYDMTTNTLAP